MIVCLCCVKRKMLLYANRRLLRDCLSVLCEEKDVTLCKQKTVM